MGPTNGKRVGIIGAGRIGQAMARTALRAGRSVVIANSRGPESLTSVVSALGEGVSAATVQQAAAAGIVVIAVPWPRVQQKAEVISLFEDAGFFTIDLGTLITGGAMQQLGAPLAGVNLIRLSEAS
jgi:predicted dinucleotide-binding enzyme